MNDILSPSFPNSVNVFLENQTSMNTKKAYLNDLQHFYRWFVSQNYENFYDVSVFIKYREYLLEKYATSTTIRMISSLKALFNWLLDVGAIRSNPIAGLKLPKAPDNATTQAFSNQQVVELLNAAKDPMHSAIFHTLFYLGLRRSELTKLRWEDIGEDSGVKTLTVHGKGGKVRVLPIPQPVLERLNSIPQDTYYIFPWHPSSINRLLKRYCEQLGFDPDFSAHSCRATAVSHFIEQGAHSIHIQQAMGWSSAEMINRYDKRRQQIKNSAIWKVNYEAA